MKEQIKLHQEEAKSGLALIPLLSLSLFTRRLGLSTFKSVE